MFFTIPKTGASTSTSDCHAIRRRRRGLEVTEVTRPDLAQPALTFPRVHPRVGSKPPTTVEPQPDIPRCSRLPRAWLGSGAVQCGEGRGGSMGHQKQLGHRLGNALPHSHCLYSDPPRTSCVLNLRPQWEVGRPLGKVRWVGKRSTSLMGDHQPSDFTW